LRQRQNGYVENFGRRFRDEVLNTEVFADLQEARELSNWSRNEYNHWRPPSILGYVAPALFAATLAPPGI